MKAISTTLPGVLCLESPRLVDARGFFSETYTRRGFKNATGLDREFVQENHSRSSYGVLRGLHYQLPPHDQGKLVQCVRGEIFDVVVDVRQSSPTLGHWFGVRLSGDESVQLWAPPGFAHGFMVLSEFADIVYKVTRYYNPESERALSWNDPTIAIKWPDLETDPILNEKDRLASALSVAELFE